MQLWERVWGKTWECDGHFTCDVHLLGSNPSGCCSAPHPLPACEMRLLVMCRDTPAFGGAASALVQVQGMMGEGAGKMWEGVAFLTLCVGLLGSDIFMIAAVSLVASS